MPENKLGEAIKELNKKHSKFGGKAIMELDKMDNANVKSIPTNCYSLDYVFGCGGLPRGRMVEIFGQESCLSGDTFISYHIKDKQGLLQNGKGGTIKHLYERFHGMKIEGRGNYQRKQTLDSDYFVSSINENNGIIKNKINDVVSCGAKECFEVTTISGERLVCTGEHKFYIGDGDYLPLNELSVGSVIYIHDNATVKGRAPQIRYKEILVKYHPRKIKKIVNGYTYYRVKKAHAVYEADKLGLTLSEYVDFLNIKSKKTIDSIWTVPKGFHVHHKNFDPHCDSLDNLVLLDGKEHNRLHALNNGDKLNFVVT